MRKTTGAGTVYASRNLTRHYASAAGWFFVCVLAVAGILALLGVPLFDWLQS